MLKSSSEQTIIDKTAIAFSTLGVGWIPFAPGTFGTLLAAMIWMVLPDEWFGISWKVWMPNLHIAPPKSDYIAYAICTGIVLAISLLAVYLTGRAERKLGHDSPRIVLDECCGYWVSVLFLPRTYMVYLYAFVLFRAFDIAKPYPIKKIQELKGGWGIVMDDLMAGLIANVLLQILIRVKPGFFYINL